MRDADGGVELRPRSGGELLAGAFELYRRHFLTFLEITAVVVVPLTLVQFFITNELLAGTIRVDEAQQRVILAPGFWRAMTAMLIVSAISVVTAQLLTGALTRAAAGAVIGERPDFGRSYAAARARLGSIVLVAFLTGLAILLGLVLLVIPGLIAFVRLLVTVPAVVVEGRRGRDALRRSWGLTAGHGWSVFGTILVAFLLSGVVQGLLTAPVRGDWITEGAVAALASLLVLPYGTILIVLIYLDLRVREEGLDRGTLAGELSSSDEPGREEA
jgi:membrane-anchored glycerophosphoryl diester phosphodiesterase (GDPDase)